jgi:hypothetical protein
VDEREFFTEDDFFKRYTEDVGKSFIFGYNTALEHDPENTSIKINSNIENKMTGFSFEGAGMAFVVIDFLFPWKNSFQKLLKEENKHEYMLYVGAGWAVARLPFKRLILSKLKPKNILYSLVLDGIGFHQGYFHWKKSIFKKEIPRFLKEKEYKSYYQGLGRSFWFVFGGNSKKISDTVNFFDKEFRGDLWSGIGLSSTYAGGRQDSIKELKEESKEYYPDLCQGSVFAAKARYRANNITLHNKYACSVYHGMSIEESSVLTDVELSNLNEPNYDKWRSSIRKNFV